MTEKVVYHTQGEVVINMVEMIDPMVHFGEMISVLQLNMKGVVAL